MSEDERPQSNKGEELKEDPERRHKGNLADEKHPVPLFLRDRSDGRQGNDQDEKDKTGE